MRFKDCSFVTLTTQLGIAHDRADDYKRRAANLKTSHPEKYKRCIRDAHRWKEKAKLIMEELASRGH